jgi:hypothetical protein
MMMMTRLNHNRVSKVKPMLQMKCAYEYIDLDLTSACTKSFSLVDYYAVSNRINVHCDEKLINLRLIKHFELALLLLSDAVKLEKVVCEWVCMRWVGGRLDAYLET